MVDQMDRVLQSIADPLMRAVVRSGCIRLGNEADITLGSKVMREELKLLLCKDHDTEGKYADERALAMTAGSGLAMASLTAECIRRIIAERAP